MLPACPHCDRVAPVWRNVRAYGWAEEHFGPDGRSESMYVDEVRYSDSQTLRCDNCNEIRRDLMVVDRRVVQKP